MAFATIEDLQGPIELVIFPKVWDKFATLVQMETVILAEGKVDAASGDPKVLVDVIKAINPEDITEETPEESGPVVNADSAGQTPSVEAGIPPFNLQPPVDTPEDFGMPVEPDDWHLAPPPQELDLFQLKSPPVEQKAQTSSQKSAALIREKPVAAVEEKPQPAVEPIRPPVVEVVEKPPVIMAPEYRSPYLSTAKNNKQLITVTLKSSGEKERDVRRMRRVHGLLNSFPGEDRFCFLVFEQGRRHLLDFPNDTTAANTELLNKLVELVGPENVQVELV